MVGTTSLIGNSQNLTWTGGDTFWAGATDLSGITAIANMGSSQVNRYPQLQGWADNYYNGLVLTDVTFTTSGSASKGQLVSQRADGTWELADADTSNTINLLGIALDNVSSNGTFAVLLNGIYSTTYHEQHPISNYGVPLYVSRTAGSVTETAPSGTGNYVRLIGHNITAGTDYSVVRFDPDCTWVIV
jgi:hypothetical protein